MCFGARIVELCGQTVHGSKFEAKPDFDAHLQRSRDSTYLEGHGSSLGTIWTHTTQRITPLQVTVATQMSQCDPEYGL